jgi:hypothetical protein
VGESPLSMSISESSRRALSVTVSQGDSDKSPIKRLLAPHAWGQCRDNVAVRLSPTDRLRLECWVRWEEEPSFLAPGRTAWMPLAEPIAHPTVEGMVLSAAKVKGIGCRDEDGAMAPVDGTREYRPVSEHAHFGIDGAGFYREVFSDPAPLGGIVLSRALSEYEAARRLLESAVPAIVPLAVYCHEHCYRGEQLAVVVTLSTEPTPFRLTSIIAADSDVNDEAERNYRQAVERALGMKSPLSSAEGLSRAFAVLAGEIGRALRGFAVTGLYRHSSGLENFQFSSSWRRVLLVDLDSSRRLADLDHRRRGLEMLRDVAAAVHKLVEAIYLHPQMLRDVGLAQILKRDPIGALLAGYFSDVSQDSVRWASAFIWSYVLPQAIVVDRGRRAAGANWPRAEREMDKRDKWVLYALAIMVCQRLLAASGLREVGFVESDGVSAHAVHRLLGDATVYLEWVEDQLSERC